MPREPGTAEKPSPGSNNIRVGIGYDSHRFDAKRPLILGGVEIPDSPGLAGHSDGDAICHALTDAILGAAALDDIGTMFPDDREENRGRDSVEMLRLAVKAIGGHGYSVRQVDVTLIAERPRIGPHRDAIRKGLAAALGISAADVGLKGKTNEGMGWIGTGEGLACIAVATLVGKVS